MSRRIIPRLQPLGEVVHDDIVQGISAAVIEGANVVTDVKAKVGALRC